MFLEEDGWSPKTWITDVMIHVNIRQKKGKEKKKEAHNLSPYHHVLLSCK